MSAVTFVGESNPYGGADEFALYPSPRGCTGWRLCHLILNMDPDDYCEHFGRMNLVRGRWSVPAARQAAAQCRRDGGRYVLLGAKVCAAFGLKFEPFTSPDSCTLILPHPSGLNRLWQQPGMFDKARAAITAFTIISTPTTPVGSVGRGEGTR